MPAISYNHDWFSTNLQIELLNPAHESTSFIVEPAGSYRFPDNAAYLRSTYMPWVKDPREMLWRDRIGIEVVSKPSIGFKVKAGRGVQPQEYIQYFED